MIGLAATDAAAATTATVDTTAAAAVAFGTTLSWQAAVAAAATLGLATPLGLSAHHDAVRGTLLVRALGPAAARGGGGRLTPAREGLGGGRGPAHFLGT